MLDKDAAKLALMEFCMVWTPETGREYYKRGCDMLENPYFCKTLERWDKERVQIREEQRYFIAFEDSTKSGYMRACNCEYAYRMLLVEFLKGE